jgi:hypothetical protein
MVEPPQGRRDLLRLIATIEAIEAQARASDAAKAAACRELLAKLAPHAAPSPTGPGARSRTAR